MKKIFLGLCFILSTSWSYGYHVVIDPGHGGRDRGATHGSLKEANITLSIGRELQKKLEVDPRFSATLTRTKDQSLSLKTRADLARQIKGDVFLSIHVNSSPDPRARGGEIYFQNQLPPDEEAMFLANLENQRENGHNPIHWPLPTAPQAKHLKPDVQNILRDLERNFRLHESSQLALALAKNWQGHRKSKSHSIRQAPFYVISHVDMPSALVEVGFLSNPREVIYLGTKKYHKKIAQGLYKGLIQFASTIKK